MDDKAVELESTPRLQNARKDVPSRRRIGLLVVHGIGAQVCGAPRDNAVRAFEEAFGMTQCKAAEGSAVPRFELGDRTVDVYEVYWADLLSGEKTHGTFRSDLFLVLIWFPFLNYRHRLYPKDLFSGPFVLFWTAILFFIGIGGFVLSCGAKFFYSLFEAWNASRQNPARNKERKVVAVDSGEKTSSFWHSAYSTVTERAESGRDLSEGFDHHLDEFAGDVINYVRSCAGIMPRESKIDADVAVQIQNRFHSAWKRAVADGCEEIQVLAHSLGTVVTYHALTGFKLPMCNPAETAACECHRPWDSLTHVYTIGSPLEKILFFWPRLITNRRAEQIVSADGAFRRGSAEDPSSPCRLIWHNFRHRWDPVAGTLRNYNHWTPVKNYSLTTGAGVFTSHVAYEANVRFIEQIGRHLFGREPKEHSRFRRWWASIRPFCENTVAPGVLVILAIAGAAMIVFAPLLLSWIVTLPWRWLKSDSLVQAQNWSFFLFAGMFTFAMVVSGILNASREHKNMRTAGEGEDGMAVPRE